MARQVLILQISLSSLLLHFSSVSSQSSLDWGHQIIQEDLSISRAITIITAAKSLLSHSITFPQIRGISVENAFGRSLLCLPHQLLLSIIPLISSLFPLPSLDFMKSKTIPPSFVKFLYHLLISLSYLPRKILILAKPNFTPIPHFYPTN